MVFVVVVFLCFALVSVALSTRCCYRMTYFLTSKRRIVLQRSACNAHIHLSGTSSHALGMDCCWRRKYFAHKVSAAALESVYICCCCCPFFSAAYAVDSRLMKRKFIQKQQKKPKIDIFPVFPSLANRLTFSTLTLLDFVELWLLFFFCSFPVTPLTERFSALFFFFFFAQAKETHTAGVESYGNALKLHCSKTYAHTTKAHMRDA